VSRGARGGPFSFAKPQADGLLASGNYPAEQDGVDVASEANLAVDFYDGDTIIEALAERWIGVDVDQFWVESVFDQ